MPDTDRPEFTSELDELIRQHSQFIYRTAFVVTRRPEDAEDVLQTIFLRLMRRTVPPTFRKNPRRYLYVATVNLSLNTIRFRRRQVLIGDLRSFDRPQDSASSDTGDSADIGNRSSGETNGKLMNLFSMHQLLGTPVS